MPIADPAPVISEIAALLGSDPREVEQVTAENTFRLYRLPGCEKL